MEQGHHWNLHMVSEFLTVFTAPWFQFSRPLDFLLQKNQPTNQPNKTKKQSYRADQWKSGDFPHSHSTGGKLCAINKNEWISAVKIPFRKIFIHCLEVLRYALILLTYPTLHTWGNPIYLLQNTRVKWKIASLCPGAPPSHSQGCRRICRWLFFLVQPAADRAAFKDPDLRAFLLSLSLLVLVNLLHHILWKHLIN